jgi:hypothetical protein
VLRSRRFQEVFDDVIFAIPSAGKRSAANFAAFNEIMSEVA